MMIFLFSFACFSALSPEEKAYYNSLPNVGYLVYLGESPSISPEAIEKYRDELLSCNLTEDDYADQEEYANELEACKLKRSKVKSMLAATKEDFDAKLGEIPNEVQYVWILLIEPTKEPLDLRKLKNKKDVAMAPFDFPSQTFSEKEIVRSIFKHYKSLIKSRFDGSPASVSRFFTLEQKTNKKAKAVTYPTLKIVGSVREKVAFLIIAGYTVNFVGSKCNTECLYLDNGILLAPDSQGIASDILYIMAHRFSNDIDPSKLAVKQFSIYSSGIVDEYTSYMLTYEQDSLQLFYPDSESPEISIPYRLSTESLGFVIGNIDRDFTVQIKKGQKALPKDLLALNLSLATPVNPNDVLYDDDQTPTITVTSSDWGESDPKPKIILTYNDADVKIDKSSLEEENFDVEVNLYPPKQPEDKDSPLPPAAIAGIVIGCVVVVAAIVAVVVYFVVFRNKGHNSSEEGEK